MFLRPTGLCVLAGNSAVRLVALVVTYAYLGLGVLGTLPPTHAEWRDLPDGLDIRNGVGLLLGVLPNNIVMTVGRLAIGLTGLAAVQRPESAVWFLRCIAVASALLAGLALVPSGATGFGLAPLGGANLWFHLAVSVVTAAAGWSPKARRALQEMPSSRTIAPSAATARVVHQLTAPFPLACFVGAAVTDLAYWWTTRPWYNGSGPFWTRASLWLIGTGVAVGVLCALVGAYARWRDDNQQSRVLTIHSSAAVVGLLFAILNVAFRALSASDPIPVGIALSLASAASLALAYWAGLAAVPRVHPDDD